jgi:uncharacterized protein
MTLPPGFVVDPPRLTGRRAFEHDWRDLAFLHWRIPVEVSAAFMPAGTRPDTFDGATYVGLVPFELRQARIRSSPPVPYFGTFLETNVRLYSVDDAGRHGVVFRSLESSRLLITLIARARVGLPYTWSRQRAAVHGSHRSWTTRRRWPAAGLRSQIGVEVGSVIADPDDMAVFLTARWGLHTRQHGRTVWMPNHHARWALRSARVVELDDELLSAAGVPVAGPPDVPTLFSAGVHVVFGDPEPI